MRITHNRKPYEQRGSLTDRLFDGHTVFFDIETTGFSAANTSLYMIGCARRDTDTICIDQYFAEDPSEEKEVLSVFLDSLEGCDTLITFNGTGFDIPYLMAKCSRFHLDGNLWSYRNIDIFKVVSKLKFLFQLENYKQKTLEAFLGLPRDDEMNGGELIEVYYTYVREPSDADRHLLHLHNYEDVLRMIDLLPLLSYAEIFEGNYTVLSVQPNDYHAYDGTIGKELLVTMQNPDPVPRPLSCRKDELYLRIDREQTRLRIPVFEGELRYFLPNPKDYYYLPGEDMAIHKSVAAFVDRQFREKACASTCYTRKCSLFLPQYGSEMEPEFRRDYRDKLRYFEMTEDFLASDELLHSYIDHVLAHMSVRSRSGQKKAI